MVNSTSRRPWFRAGLIGAALAAAALVGVVAQAQPGGHGMGGMGPGLWLGGPPEHTARMVDHMLDGLNATDAQRTQIKQIALGLASDLKPQHDAGRALHEKAAALLTAPNVDANAAEQVRQQMLAQHDQVSRRVLTAMLDMSRVLTPEQRATVATRMKQRSDAMRERMQRMQRDKPAS